MNATALLLSVLATIILVLLAVMAFRRRARGREQAVRQLLDAADALEARLRTARSEIEAVAGEHIDDPVQAAMREMLRQRLWLREHGEDASLDEIHQVRASIDDARGRIELQLGRIEQARATEA